MQGQVEAVASEIVTDWLHFLYQNDEGYDKKSTDHEDMDGGGEAVDNCLSGFLRNVIVAGLHHLLILPIEEFLGGAHGEA